MESKDYKERCEVVGEQILKAMLDGYLTPNIIADMLGIDDVHLFFDSLNLLVAKRLVINEISVVTLTEKGEYKARSRKHFSSSATGQPNYNTVVWQTISNELYKQRFTDQLTDFISLLRDGKGKCNWTGNHTTLVYFLHHMLYPGRQKVPPYIRTLIHEYFTVNGVTPSLNDISAAISKAKRFLIIPQSSLRGQYYAISIIIEDALP